MKYTFFIILFFFFGNNFQLSGSNYKIEYLTADDNLQHSFIHYIYQDSRGFLWIGMRNGLSRYDGYNFVTYQNNPFDTNSLSGNIISCIQEDSKGNLWIGTQNTGLNYFERKTGRIKRYRYDSKDLNSLGNDAIYSMKISSTDELWITTLDWGLYHYMPGKTNFKVPYKYKDSLFANIMNKCLGTLYIDKYDNISFVYKTHEYILVLKYFSNLKEIKIIRKYNTEIVSDISILGLDSQDNIWLNMLYKNDNRELSLINNTDGSTIRTIEYDKELKKRNCRINFQKDKNDILWMFVTIFKNADVRQAEYYRAFYRLGNINSLKMITNKNKLLESNQLLSMSDEIIQMEDKQGIIWTKYLQGLVKLIPISSGITNFIHKPMENSISNNYIRSIMVDKKNNIYIGTDFGFNIQYKSKNIWKNIIIGKSRELNENKVNALYEDENGKILIGTNNGVHIYDSKNSGIQKFNNKVFGNNPAIWSFYRDISHNLWIGTINGLYIFDKNNKLINEYFTNKNWHNSGGNPCWLIYNDKQGNIWIGTNTGILKWLPNEKYFKRYHHNDKDSNSICGNTVWSIAEDINGNLWIGAYGAGISRYDYDKDSFSSITNKDGLPDNGIGSIICDKSNNLWMGTDKGLVKYNQNSKTFLVYNTDDGFANNSYSLNVYGKCKDGSLLFGGLNGVTRFYPDSLKLNKRIPDIAVTSFKINSKEIFNELLDGDTVNIDWENNHFSFEYAVLDYHNSKQNQYAYKLVNMNDEWIFAGTDRNIAFSNLAPGEYIFKVKGSNNHGVWNEKGISIYVNIIPPYYMTSWFRILTVLMLCCVLTFIHISRNKTRKLKELTKRRILVSQLKALQTQMNPHFIFNSLNAILNLILNNESELSIQYLNKFSKLLRDILENSRNLSVTLKKEIEYLTLYLELESLRFENRFKYRITVAPNINQEQISVPTLLIQPYIENSIRHGIIQNVENGKVEVNFSINSEYLFCDIIDNGIGRQKSKEIKAKSQFIYKSFGMEVNRERLELLKSKVEVIDLFDSNNEPSGTHIKLMLNLKADLINE